MQERNMLTFYSEFPLSAFPNPDLISHEMIIETVKNGNGDECEKIIRLHIQRSKQRIMENVMEIKLNQFE